MANVKRNEPTIMAELTQIQMLAALGVLAVLAREDERGALRISTAIGGVTPDLSEAAAARSWLEKKLRTLDVSALPTGGLSYAN